MFAVAGTAVTLGLIRASRTCRAASSADPARRGAHNGSGELAAERIGNRHRLVLDDVLAYREARRQRQYDALAESAMDIDADEDPEVICEQLREARRVVAARRRTERRRA